LTSNQSNHYTPITQITQINKPQKSLDKQQTCLPSPRLRTQPNPPTTINYHSPTNTIFSGGSGASEKFQKQQAEKQGLGADNAAGHTEGHRPGEAPVASDSGSTNVGQDPSRNNPGTEGIKGEPVSSKPDSTGANMK
jgi:hypothetical protein